MKTLKGAGKFVIMTPPSELRRQLLGIERAGRTCYQSETGKIAPESAARFVRMLLRRGHESVLEHSSLTVKFLNCSRGFTHELVRHRLMAISQESTRYVDYARRGQGQLHCIVPPHRDEFAPVELEDGRKLSMVDMLEEIEKFYRALRLAGWVPEDARQILPDALRAEIVITANFREWRHIFAMRTQKAAHWEIRQMMCNLLVEIQQLVPVVFDDFVEVGADQHGLRFFAKQPLS